MFQSFDATSPYNDSDIEDMSENVQQGPELKLTAEEKEIQRYLQERLPAPQKGIFDSMNTSIERLEPLAQDIEKMLRDKEFERFIDKETRRNAKEAVQIFRAQRKKAKSTLFGQLPMFGLMSAVNSLSSQLEARYADLKTRISTEWKARKLAEAYIREARPDESQLERQQNDLDEATDDLQSAYNGMQTQIVFGQYVLQNLRNSNDGLLRAEAVDNKLSPVVYIDFSGEKKGEQAQGSYGSIHLAWASRDKSGSEEVFAVKVPRSHRSGRNVWTHCLLSTYALRRKLTMHPLKELSREGEIWSFLQTPVPHPNILEFYGTCRIGGLFTGLLSRWIPASKSWKDSLGDFDEVQHIEFLERIADAVRYMHDRVVIHGDVKLANVIISRDPLKPLLCDFGYSLRREIDSTSDSAKGGASGPYGSPEAYKGNRKTNASDVWSFGICIIHKMDNINIQETEQTLMRRLPFEEHVKNAEDIQGEYYKLFVTENLRPSIPVGLTAGGTLAWSVAQACVANTTAARPDMKEVHVYLQNVIAGRMEMSNALLELWKQRASHFGPDKALA
ncbi:hypothetical protein FRB90_000974 [Tulasnella sp. 427]|nr:hypothetical protein FRB90_000974 [Tulasnella sp. 427]